MSEEYVTVNKKDYDEILLQLKAWRQTAISLRLERDKFKRIVEANRRKALREINDRD